MEEKERIKSIVSRLREINDELGELCNEAEFHTASYIAEQSTFIDIAREKLEELLYPERYYLIVVACTFTKTKEL